MKKYKGLLMCLIAIGFLFASCNNSLTDSLELTEYAKQFHFNIDTTKTYDMNIKVFQSLDDCECLAQECSNDLLELYNGQVLYYVSPDLVYDGKIIKEKAYLFGTYHYVSNDNMNRVVPFYCEISQYKKNVELFNTLVELQKK